MKRFTLVVCCLVCHVSFSQQLQLHYDARHTLDPKLNRRNFATAYFEYFKILDSGNRFIKPGSFLLKVQGDFSGENGNAGKFFMQISQAFRFWRPKVFINLQYSGGLGVTEPKEYSYYIVNSYSVGISYPFRWGSAYMSSVLNYKYTSYNKASHDFLYTLYWWEGLWNYKVEIAGDFSVWTENKNHGDEPTKDLSAKRFYFFAEPQFWYRLNARFGIGARINLFYHVLTTENSFQAYPTLGLRCKL